MPGLPDLERLLREGAWARRLARRLVADPQGAEDLVQDAWVAALERSGPAPDAPRAWLGSVLRNLGRERLRGERRRRDREQRTSPGEPEPPAGDVVAELSLQRHVTELLIELPEPFRTTLHLRFHQDLPLREIGRRQGVSPSTVHERVERGLELLRARLDGAYGERRAWVLALLPLARPSGVSSTLAGGLAVSTTVKILLASTLVTGGLAGAFWLRSEGRWGTAAPPRLAGPEARETLAASPVLEDDPGGLGDGGARAALPAGPAPRPAAPAAAPEPAAEPPYAGRVVDLGGRALASVEIGHRTRGDAVAWLARSNAAGRFEVPGDVSTEPPNDLVARDATYTTLVPGRPSHEDEAVVVVTEKRTLEGRVVDPAGAPLAGALVTLRMSQSIFRELGLRRPFAYELPGWTARTDEEGGFRLVDLPGGPGVFLEAQLEGYEGGRAETEPAPSPLVVVLEPKHPERTVAGVVLDPAGRPVDGVRVSFGQRIVRTADGGRFRLDLGEDGLGIGPLDVEPGTVVAVQPGFRPARAQVDLQLPLQEVVLQLGEEPLEIRGRVVDEEGEPRPGAVVWIRDPSDFGLEVQSQGDFGVSYATTVEEVLAGGRNELSSVTDAEGRFALKGLLDRDYDVQAYDPRTLAVGEGWRVAAGSRSAELVLASPPLVRIAGRIRSPSQGPLEGITVSPRRAWATDGGRPVLNTFLEPPQGVGVFEVTTDAEGRFELATAALEGERLELEGDRVPLLKAIALDGREDLEHLEIDLPLLSDLQVDLGDRPAMADRVEVLDEEGRPLRIHESFGMFLAFDTDVTIDDGRTSVVQVTEGPRTVVLYLGEEEVARLPVELVPGELRTVRP